MSHALKVVCLTQYQEKGAPGVVIPKAELLEGLGMEGNMYQGGEWQLSLLSSETRGWMDSQKKRGFCFERFKENILTEGISLETLETGQRLSVGDAIIRISMQNKRCHSECVLFSKGMECRLSKGAAFAAVERGGFVCAGDPICLL